jgi:serine phosphatase RsbU (regulator of sigma subunit)/pSer/pThr/pTyr-binding forkhead associated (FHA) protein
MVQLPAEAVTIGRADTATITITDTLASREHAAIEPAADNRFRVRDLGSRNKTIVNGQVISETLLSPGDVIRIGARVFDYVQDLVIAGRRPLDFLTPDKAEPKGCEWVRIKAPQTLTLDQLEKLAAMAYPDRFAPKPEEVADWALSRLVVDLEADRGFIALRGEEKNDLRPIAHRGLAATIAGGLMPASETFVMHVVLQEVSGRYPLAATQIESRSGFAATAVAAPLTFRGKVVGMVYLDRPNAEKPFSEKTLSHIAAAGAQIGALLAETSHRRSASGTKSNAAWIATLRKMQMNLMPVPIAEGSLESAMRLQPGAARCGDLYDMFRHHDDRLTVITLDGGGHGMAGIVQAASIRAAIRTAMCQGQEPSDLGDIMTALSQTLAGQSTRQVVACSVVDLDIKAGQAHYVCAGAPAPIIMAGPARLVTLDQTSLVLGVDPEYDYETTTVDTPPEYRLICHTDGLIDCGNAAGDSFSSRRLHDLLLERSSFGPPAEMVANVIKAVEAHMAGEQADDDALILVAAAG